MSKELYTDIWDLVYLGRKTLVDHLISFVDALKSIKEGKLQARLELNANIPGQDPEDESGASNASSQDAGLISHVTWWGVVTRAPKIVDAGIDWRDRLISISGIIVENGGNNGQFLPSTSGSNQLRTPGLRGSTFSLLVGKTHSRIRCDFYSGSGDQPEPETTNEPFDYTDGVAVRRFCFARWSDSLGATGGDTTRNHIYFWVDNSNGNLMTARGKTTAPNRDHDMMFMAIPSPVVR